MRLLRRAVLRCQMRALEITIDGASECLACVSDPARRFQIEIARSTARRELARVRAAYQATLPPGRRQTWRLA